MRGSILRNTNFVIGIVVYVGTDTKAHQNAKQTQRKQSWLITSMHTQFIKMFVMLGIIVIAFSIGATVFTSVYDTPYLYKQVGHF